MPAGIRSVTGGATFAICATKPARPSSKSPAKPETVHHTAAMPVRRRADAFWINTSIWPPRLRTQPKLA